MPVPNSENQSLSENHDSEIPDVQKSQTDCQRNAVDPCQESWSLSLPGAAWDAASSSDAHRTSWDCDSDVMPDSADVLGLQFQLVQTQNETGVDTRLSQDDCSGVETPNETDSGWKPCMFRDVCVDVETQNEMPPFWKPCLFRDACAVVETSNETDTVEKPDLLSCELSAVSALEPGPLEIQSQDCGRVGFSKSQKSTQNLEFSKSQKSTENLELSGSCENRLETNAETIDFEGQVEKPSQCHHVVCMLSTAAISLRGESRIDDAFSGAVGDCDSQSFVTLSEIGDSEVNDWETCCSETSELPQLEMLSELCLESEDIPLPEPGAEDDFEYHPEDPLPELEGGDPPQAEPEDELEEPEASAAEVFKHLSRGHEPYESTCMSCTRASGRTPARRLKTRSTSSSLGTDFTYLGSLKILAIIIFSTGFLGAVVMNENLESCARQLNQLLRKAGKMGREISIHSDGEPSLLASFRSASRLENCCVNAMHIVPSPPDRSQTNGRVERANGMLKELVCRNLFELESRVGTRIPVESPIVPHIVRYAYRMFNLFHQPQGCRSVALQWPSLLRALCFEIETVWNVLLLLYTLARWPPLEVGVGASYLRTPKLVWKKVNV